MSQKVRFLMSQKLNSLMSQKLSFLMSQKVNVMMSQKPSFLLSQNQNILMSQKVNFLMSQNLSLNKHFVANSEFLSTRHVIVWYIINNFFNKTPFFCAVIHETPSLSIFASRSETWCIKAWNLIQAEATPEVFCEKRCF